MTLFIDTTLKYYYVRSIINNTYITNYLLTDNNYLLNITMFEALLTTHT